MNAAPGAAADVNVWTPRIILSFLALSLIWGSTWIVIKDQLGIVPPIWSISYRFIAATLAMFALAALRGQPLLLDKRGHVWALALGLTQFVFNFNFVYGAELYITSGLVAVMFALLMVPNAILARLFLGQRISRAFVLGSIVAGAGVALLFVQEYRQADIGLVAVLIGAALTCGGILSASSANILQATEGAKRYPILTLLGWAMLWGTLFNLTTAMLTAGPPIVEPRATYFIGLIYLGVIGSTATFPVYFGLVREIGAGRAAYMGLLIPIVAMIFSTIFEGYRWSWLAIGGAVLGLCGLVIAMAARRPKVPRVQG